MTETRTCAYDKCQVVFPVPRQNKAKRYCTADCGRKATQPWKAGSKAHIETAAKRRAERLAATPKEDIAVASYSDGYQAARHRYHYRSFLTKLLSLIAASVPSEPSEGPRGPR